jgi:hypothetical protein
VCRNWLSHFQVTTPPELRFHALLLAGAQDVRLITRKDSVEAAELVFDSPQDSMR